MTNPKIGETCIQKPECFLFPSFIFNRIIFFAVLSADFWMSGTGKSFILKKTCLSIQNENFLIFVFTLKASDICPGSPNPRVFKPTLCLQIGTITFWSSSSVLGRFMKFYVTPPGSQQPKALKSTLLKVCQCECERTLTCRVDTGFKSVTEAKKCDRDQTTNWKVCSPVQHLTALKACVHMPTSEPL